LKKVAIIGGGLAGLISGIELSKKGVPCVLFERKEYPFHRVCGEYISNEVVPFLKKAELYPENLNPSRIDQFQISAIRGQSATMPLDIGGFGISRYTFDNFLSQKARALGVTIHVNTDVEAVTFHEDNFKVNTTRDNVEADVVVGAFGKRSRLDMTLDRNFIHKRSPYVGVKYHVKTDHKDGLVALHNFMGGYCGIANIEDGLTNLCYLASRDVLQRSGSVSVMEEEILCANPKLRQIFKNSDFVTKKPLVINEISFETKNPVEDHILMAGDAAGMITPLCGNGMAMAIHSAKIASELIFEFCNNKISRQELERSYRLQWTKLFSQRLRTGRTVQRLFGNAILSTMAVNMILHSKTLSKMIMRRTHGQEF
jgi:flavin-dependent dehydrogenase